MTAPQPPSSAIDDDAAWRVAGEPAQVSSAARVRAAGASMVVGGRAWAQRLRDRERHGDRLGVAQRRMWRRALGLGEKEPA